MQRGATTPSRAKRGGCGSSLEDELCPYEIEGWTVKDTSPAVCRLTLIKGYTSEPGAEHYVRKACYSFVIAQRFDF